MIGGWDVETEGLGGKLLSISYGCLGHVIFDDGENKIKNFVEYICNFPQPFVWYAHHSQYDWRYLMDYLADSGYKLDIGMRTDNDIYQICILLDGKRVVMRDFAALFEKSLAEFAELFCPEYPKLEIDIEKFNSKNPGHVAYAKRDVEILLRGIPKFFALLHTNFGIEAGNTAAGTAVKAWQNTLPNNVVFNGSKLN